jgi:hypothetical protein
MPSLTLALKGLLQLAGRPVPKSMADPIRIGTRYSIDA